MAKGKKNCPKCKKVVGCRTFKCSCGYEFIIAEKKEVVKNKKLRVVEKDNEEKNWVPPFPMPDAKEFKKTTPIAHAKRILSYGEKRASILLKCSKGTWPHVDWDYVREELKNIK